MLSLEAVLFECGKIDRLLSGADADMLPRNDVRTIRVAVAELTTQAQSVMDWLSEQRLEDPKQ
jgi:ribosome recycling factor